MAEIEAIAKLVNQLSKLPGVGRKTAQRLAYHIIGLPEEQVRELAVAIFNGKKQLHFCPVCGNYTDVDPCAICADSSRRRDIVCVVRDPRDVNALERMREYDGLYHVLHGVISPMNHVGPDDLHIKELVDRTYKEEIALRDAQIQALQSRINPHFINNALEDINWQARILGAPESVPAGSTASTASRGPASSRSVPLTSDPMCMTWE